MKGSLCKASKLFLCRPCQSPSSDSEIRTCISVDGGFSVELVDEFCYLWDTLGVDGDADAVMTAGILSGCFKFGSLIPFLTARDSLLATLHAW